MADDALVGAGGVPLSADILRHLLDSSQDVLYAVALTPDVHMLYATPAFARRMGLPDDFLERGYHFSQYLASVHLDDTPRVARIMAAIVSSRSDEQLPENPAVYRLRTPEGGWRVISDSYRILRDAQGVPHTLIGNARDIFERSHAQQTLKERDARFRLLAENSRDIFFSMRFPEGSYEYISPSVEDLFAISPQEFYDDPGTLMRCIAPDWLETVQGWMAEIAQGRVAESYEYQVRDKGGRLLWLSQRQVLVPAPSGKGALLQGVATDVTALREAQKALAESEARFRSLAENSRDIFFTFRLPEGRYEYISARVEDIHGHPPQAFYDDPGLFMRCVAPAWRDQMRGWMAEVSQGKLRDKYEFEIVDRHGRLRWIEERLVLVPTPDGQGVLLQGVASDQTEEHAAREALLASEERYRQLAEGWLDQAVIRINLHTNRYEYVSPGMQRLFGFAPEEFYQGARGIVGNTVAPEWREAAQEWMAEAWREGLKPVYEFELIDAWGQRRWVHLRCTLLHASDGTPAAVQGVLYDNTERKRLEQQLAASEHKYRTLHESMRDGYASVDKDGFIVEHNSAFRDMLGYTDEEIPKLTYFDITPERWHAEEERILKEHVLTRGYSDVYEKEYRRKDGSLFPVSLRTYLETDDSGQPGRLWAIVRDITDQKRAEEALRKSNARNRLIVETATEGIWSVDALERATFVNAAMAEMMGYTPQEMLGRTTESFLFPEDIPAHRKRIATRRTGKDEVYERRFRRKDGTTLWVLASAKPLWDDAGSFDGAFAMFVDITERKRTEQALRDTNARYALLAENVVDVIWTTDENLRWTYLSPSAERLSGIPLARLMDMRFDELFTPESMSLIAGLIAKRRREPAPSGKDEAYRQEMHIRHADGSLLPLEVLVRPMRGPNGEITGYCGTSRDITERIRAEQALRSSEQRFSELIRHSSNSITILDANGTQIFASEAAERIVGYTPSELTNISIIEEMVHPEDQEQVAAAFATILRDGECGAHYRHRHKDGSWVHLEAWGTNQLDNPDIRGIVVNARDITERKRAEAALRESEERYRQLAESWTEHVLMRINLRTMRHEYVSPSVERLFGYTPEQYLNGDPKVLGSVAPEWREQVFQWIQETANGVLRPEYEYEVFDAWGSRRWVYQRGALLLDETGAPSAVQFLLSDITERKHTEEALRISQERYALALKGANDGLWDWDLLKDEVYFSDRWKEIIGYAPEEIRHDASEWAERIHPDDFDRIMEANKQCILGEVPVFQVEYRLRHKDGSYRWIYGRGAALADATGRVVRMAGAHTDITARKQAEEALFKSERLSRKLLESMHEGVWAVDANRRTTFVNERLCAMLGYASAELMNMSPTDVLEWPQRHVAKSQLSDLEAGYSGATDYVLIRKDGSRFPAHVLSSPVMEEQGRFEGLVCGVVDLTERARMEHELRRNQARFEALYELSRLTPATEFQLASFTLREAIRLTDSSAGVLFFVSEDGQQLVPKAWETGDDMAEGQVPSFPSSGPLPWATVLQSGLPLLINDFSECSPLVPPGHTDISRFLGVPALDGARPVAVLGLIGKDEPYTAEDTLQTTLLLDGMWREVRTRRDEERIRASLREKEALLHEVHHRVKNNLQVISSLMDMAGRRLANPEARQSLMELRGKVQAMSLIHAQLQGAGSDGRISLERFVQALFHQLREIYSGGLDLSLTLRLGDLALSLDQAVPLGLALNETLTNVFKHACPPQRVDVGLASLASRASRVEIRAERDPAGQVSLEVEDDGPGLPEGLDPDNAESLGMKLIRGLVRHQLRGELRIAQANPGVCVGIRFRPHIAG
ncbi:MAG: PAS domain S-box protein [Humidesulfovibrio sp.]|uniref:PAS domain-containing sensor histidine kinase n=1 Tax=Humidesulfovibrio sp. TaxID=2910988 RepID=UPI0027F1EB74|nr:PAS domain S-box protein [Humidesulfovibrio sp.]MDQ7836161.1 PAS domain S-box protein [Humidesulfovibrio sp.]